MFAPQMATAPIVNGIEVIDVVTDENINEALNMILKHVSKEDFISLANTIEKEPAKIQLAIKMFS